MVPSLNSVRVRACVRVYVRARVRVGVGVRARACEHVVLSWDMSTTVSVQLNLHWCVALAYRSISHISPTSLSISPVLLLFWFVCHMHGHMLCLFLPFQMTFI
jgi:hypothetical protein